MPGSLFRRGGWSACKNGQAGLLLAVVLIVAGGCSKESATTEITDITESTGTSVEAEQTAEASQVANTNTVTNANPSRGDQAQRQQFEVYRELVKKLSAATDETEKAALQAQLQQQREVMLQIHREQAELRQSQTDPAELARREKERQAFQDFMGTVRDMHPEQRRLAVMEFKLRQRGLDAAQIEERLKHYQTSLTQAAPTAAEQAARTERHQALQAIMEQYQDADRATRQQAIRQWRAQQRNVL